MQYKQFQQQEAALIYTIGAIDCATAAAASTFFDKGHVLLHVGISKAQDVLADTFVVNLDGQVEPWR